ncbi:MAG: SDR family oxidoreductase [Thalassobaculum sp.]|uniref:SDR family NAD(P)-dependent oxidoreductase n=1 Tax=Thalassobaculum sp. TaxID=2022740 RepID=UPI0032EEAB15
MAERVLVTGGARSIGRGIVARLLHEEYEVTILDREAPEPSTTAHWIQVDLMDGEATDAAVREALADGPITRVVHNVGHVRPNQVDETRLADFDDVMTLNVKTVIRITQALLPGMRAAHSGRVVAISSRAALGKELRSSYAASKAALHGLMKTWALELARDGITANAVAPGSIETPLWHAANPSQDPRTQKILESIPVGRLGQPEDIANAVAFFLDRRSGFVTGQVLYVCGGLTVGSARA